MTALMGLDWRVHVTSTYEGVALRVASSAGLRIAPGSEHARF